jgi:hypothetical protein
MGAHVSEVDEAGCDVVQRDALSEQGRAYEMNSEIAIPEAEPVLSTPARGGVERVPRLVGPSPAALVIAEAGKRVEEAVEVG